MDKGTRQIGYKPYRINLIQRKTTHYDKLGLMGVQKSYIDASSAQVTAQGLFGGFSFCYLEELKGGGFMNPLPRGKNTVIRNSEKRIPRKSSENQKKFTGAN